MTVFCYLVLLWTLLLRIHASNIDPQPIHVAFLTDCSLYSNWQSLADTFSFKMSGQRGSVTRVMCCSPEDLQKYPPELLKEVKTHIAPSLAFNPKNNDNYAAYNKPEAVIDWLEHVTPEEEFVLVLDSDMILRYPFIVEDMQPKKGLAVGAKYTYMIGVANELADRHIKHVEPRKDTLAGPYGRRADQVGGFFFIHRDDLKRMSHDWLTFSEQVRFDDQAYRLSGDSYAIHKGDKPWISEMYGYAFGAANNSVWHVWDDVSMIYPQYDPYNGVPKLLHYGLRYDVENRYFNDKHFHYNLDVMVCPPWNWSNDQSSPKAGLFPFPPHPSSVRREGKTIFRYVKDLISLETTATLNAALCDFHLRHCPPSQELLDLCERAFKWYKDSITATRKAEEELQCPDGDQMCTTWAEKGECEKNPGFMSEHCKKACDQCEDQSEIPLEVLRPVKNFTYLDDLMESVRVRVGGARDSAPKRKKREEEKQEGGKEREEESASAPRNRDPGHHEIRLDPEEGEKKVTTKAGKGDSIGNNKNNRKVSNNSNDNNSRISSNDSDNNSVSSKSESNGDSKENGDSRHPPIEKEQVGKEGGEGEGGSAVEEGKRGGRKGEGEEGGKDEEEKSEERGGTERQGEEGGAKEEGAKEEGAGSGTIQRRKRPKSVIRSGGGRKAKDEEQVAINPDSSGNSKEGEGGGGNGTDRVERDTKKDGRSDEKNALKDDGENTTKKGTSGKHGFGFRTAHLGGKSESVKGALAGAPTWLILILWVSVVLLFLTLLRALLRRRARVRGQAKMQRME